MVANSGSVSDPYGYEAEEGYYTDQSTGLCLTTFRYYDPGAGRFLNRDPSGLGGGINLYGYTQNNAENRVDRLGLDSGETNWEQLQDCLADAKKDLLAGLLGDQDTMYATFGGSAVGVISLRGTQGLGWTIVGAEFIALWLWEQLLSNTNKQYVSEKLQCWNHYYRRMKRKKKPKKCS